MPAPLTQSAAHSLGFPPNCWRSNGHWPTMHNLHPRSRSPDEASGHTLRAGPQGMLRLRKRSSLPEVQSSLMRSTVRYDTSKAPEGASLGRSGLIHPASTRHSLATSRKGSPTAPPGGPTASLSSRACRLRQSEQYSLSSSVSINTPTQPRVRRRSGWAERKEGSTGFPTPPETSLWKGGNIWPTAPSVVCGLN